MHVTELVERFALKSTTAGVLKFVEVAKIKNVYKHTFAKSANQTTVAATTSQTNSVEFAKKKT